MFRLIWYLSVTNQTEFASFQLYSAMLSSAMYICAAHGEEKKKYRTKGSIADYFIKQMRREETFLEKDPSKPQQKHKVSC